MTYREPQPEIRVHAFLTNEFCDEDQRFSFFITVWKQFGYGGKLYMYQAFPDTLGMEDLLEVMDAPIAMKSTPNESPND